MRATGTTTPMRVLPDTTVAAFTVVLCIVATIVTGLIPALRDARDAADFSAASRGPSHSAAGRRPDCAARRPGHAQRHAALRRNPAHARPDPRLEHRSRLFAAHGFGGQVTLPAQAHDARAPGLFARSCATRSPPRASDRWEWRTKRRCSRQHSGHVRRPQDAAADARRVHLRSYSSELFTLLKIPVVAGRLFDERQTGEVVINEAMARAFWPDSTAVGQRLIEGSRTVEVVGVVRDVQLIDLGAVEPAMFMPRMLAATVLPQFLVRSDLPPDQIRGIIGQLESRATSPSRRWPTRCGRR